jgi:type IV pilus assembly protein PilO
VNPSDLAREAARSRATLAMLRRLVPTEHEVPGLLEQVSTAARRAGLEIGGVAPEPVLAGTEFDTYRYKITVAGGFHALAQFLGNVGSLPRIVAPVTFQLTPRIASGRGARRGAVTGRGQPLNATVTMQTYVAHAAPPARTRVAAASASRGGEVVR